MHGTAQRSFGILAIRQCHQLPRLWGLCLEGRTGHFQFWTWSRFRRLGTCVFRLVLKGTPKGKSTFRGGGGGAKNRLTHLLKNIGYFLMLVLTGRNSIYYCKCVVSHVLSKGLKHREDNYDIGASSLLGFALQLRPSKDSFPAHLCVLV